jgi:hypothetical protein
MKNIHLLVACSLLIILVAGCKKDTTKTSGVLTLTVSNLGSTDSTSYIITSGELNVNANGIYATTAISGNTALNISIVGQLVNGPNAIGSGGNSPMVVITTNTGGVSTVYNNISGGVILSGNNLTFELSMSSSGGALDFLEGTVNY